MRQNIQPNNLRDKFQYVRLEERQVGFITGYIISNIVSEVKQYWRGQVDSPDWNREVKTAFKLFNNKTSLISIALRAINKNQNRLTHAIQDIKQDIEPLPSLESFNAFIIAEIRYREILLEQFAVVL